MRKPFFLLSFAVVLLGVAVTSGAAPTPRTEEHNGQQNFRGGIIIGNARVGTKLSNVTSGTLDYDFPSLGGTMTALDTYCAVSGSVTITGARFGDACVVGIDQAPVNGFGVIRAYVTASDTAVIQACASGITDGGSFNQPDSGYTVRCFAP